MHRRSTKIAGLMLAGGALVGTVAVASPASADTQKQDGLVNVAVGDIIVAPNVTAAVAANICGITVNAVSVVDDSGNRTECKALSSALTKAYVLQN
jgi:hypothetical protein